MVAHGPIRIVRPLLGIEKAQLLSWLAEKAIPWSEDPSNAAPVFERSSWRRLRSELNGLGLTTPQLTTSARRLARASMALQSTARTAVEQAGSAIVIDDLGYAQISWPWLTSLPEEIRLRVLGALIGWTGGGLGRGSGPAREEGTGRVSLGHLEGLTVYRDWISPAGRTLAGTAFSVGGDGFVVLTREPPRGERDGVPIQPGQSLVWDGRFRVSAGEKAPAGCTVAPLGAEGVSRLVREAALRRPRAPARALRALPAIWDGKQLVAAPLLGYGPTNNLQEPCFSAAALPFAL